MLEKEFQYFLKHHDDLLEEHNGKYVVIVDETVVGSYDPEIEAYTESVKQYDPGTFLIQQVTPGNDAYTATYRSRAAL